ncbi:TIGR01777 family oxidoreductase [Amycolatopsis sp. CA-230715]|uniref:TIGR01777 family oxidoreductase n=1 Tax=Amycolatopsis sp. CA-230715 TaxID=2745196 RepID=UPI001C03256F|nr:TIGR01777 family oxidoreductase [Amycolatopsis sp. CA-230715]QWF84990.1 Epimerase family protein [Amycolatopsis sp. CA-230715]
MTERIVMTGGTGLVGKAVAAALIDSEYEVVLLARDLDRARSLVPNAAGYLPYRSGERGGWETALAGADHVVNLAGAPVFKPFTGRRHLRKVTAQRIEGALQLVAAIHRAPNGPRTLLNASSVGVYGFGAPADGLVDEKTAPIPGEHTRGSREWETAAAAEPAARTVLLRLSFVLTGNGGGLKWQLDQARKGRSSYFAPGSQWLPWIHLDDVVAFVRRALGDDSWKGAYNLVAPEHVRSREFAETLARATAADPPRRSPALLARLFVGAGADIVLGGRRVTPARLLESGFEFRYPDLAGALRECAGAAK